MEIGEGVGAAGVRREHRARLGRQRWRRRRRGEFPQNLSVCDAQADCAAFVVTKKLTVHAGIERLGLPLNVRLGSAMTFRATHTPRSDDVTTHVYRIVHSHGRLLVRQRTEMFRLQSGR